MEDTNEDTNNERERSRSRDRGTGDDFQETDNRGAAESVNSPGGGGEEEGNGHNYTESRRDRNEGHESRRYDQDPDVNNLYVTNLSFQVI